MPKSYTKAHDDEVLSFAPATELLEARARLHELVEGVLAALKAGPPVRPGTAAGGLQGGSGPTGQ